MEEKADLHGGSDAGIERLGVLVLAFLKNACKLVLYRKYVSLVAFSLIKELVTH